MSEANLTEAQRKMLTEWLGECWHRWDKNGYCKKCRVHYEDDDRLTFRPFTTPDDMMALKEKVCSDPEQKKRFHIFAWERYVWWCFPKSEPVIMAYFWEFLVNPPRFCRLVAEWLEQST